MVFREESTMLRFQYRPDPIFIAILHDALEEMQEGLIHLNDDDDAEGGWRAFYPLASKVFSLSLATETIARLLTASGDPTLYQIRDYHWLLIYDCLRTYCDVHNDFVDENGGPIQVGPYRIGEIDFDAILDLYFWDTDFLVGPAEVAALGPEGREMMGMSAEAFGIAQGLVPHAEELKIEPWDEPYGDAEAGAGPPAGTVIPRFPPEPEHGEVGP
jgi:hypothetical protein